MLLPWHLPCVLVQNVGDNKSTSALLDKGVEKSPSKSRQPRKVDLRARYWAFLFENLRRAVGEIYLTCESDQSVVECRVRHCLCMSYSLLNMKSELDNMFCCSLLICIYWVFKLVLQILFSISAEGGTDDVGQLRSWFQGSYRLDPAARKIREHWRSK